MYISAGQNGERLIKMTRDWNDVKDFSSLHFSRARENRCYQGKPLGLLCRRDFLALYSLELNNENLA